MKKVIIYYNKEKTSFQTISPSTQFNGDWKGLIETVTGSDDFTKKYHSYEVY